MRPHKEKIRKQELRDVPHGESSSYEVGDKRIVSEWKTKDDRKIDRERNHTVGSAAISLPIVISITGGWSVWGDESNVKKRSIGVDKL